VGFFGKMLGSILGIEKCPACGTPGARKSGTQISCLNPFCRNFDTGKQNKPVAPAQPPQPVQQTQPPAWGKGLSVERTIIIRYRNFQGQDKVFSADAASLRRRKNHISANVAPTGQRITFARSRIQNLSEVEAQMPERTAPGQDWPSAKERQVLGYHKKHGTTSPLYEKIRAKYPNW
jgi:hypothetical protein